VWHGADVLQATFLVLARKAQSIRNRESLAGWLHGVGHRLARQARLAETVRSRRDHATSSSSPSSCTGPCRSSFLGGSRARNQRTDGCVTCRRPPPILGRQHHNSTAELDPKSQELLQTDDGQSGALYVMDADGGNRSEMLKNEEFLEGGKPTWPPK